jgi:hypothetical protein
VFHQSTENFTIGILIIPINPKNEDNLALLNESEIVNLKISMLNNIINITNTDVSRASQTHHVPHVGLPHNEPVIKVITTNNKDKKEKISLI